MLNDHKTVKIVPNGKTWKRTKGRSRNEPCECGSGKKAKKCCVFVSEPKTEAVTEPELGVEMTKMSDEILSKAKQLKDALTVISGFSSDELLESLAILLVASRGEEGMKESEIISLFEYFQENISLPGGMFLNAINGHLSIHMEDGQSEPSFSMTDAGCKYVENMLGNKEGE